MHQKYSDDEEFYTKITRQLCLSEKKCLFAIDPGVRNFGLSCLEARAHVCLDFGTFRNLEKKIAKLFKSIFASCDPSLCVVLIENQRGSCQNQRVEWFARGILAAIGVRSVIGIPPYSKNKWCRESLGWEYVKCSTRKAFKNAFETNTSFRTLVSNWTRAYINMSTGQTIIAKTVFEIVKSDEFVDTLILLSIGNEGKKPSAPKSSVGKSGTIGRKRTASTKWNGRKNSPRQRLQ